jgi:hypothetical protein
VAAVADAGGVAVWAPAIETSEIAHARKIAVLLINLLHSCHFLSTEGL